eukprot:TRINITY_DN472_c0_g1_i1.p1 TRINITY_DN472_c0_g1~~TRINITY_DN472_c0_g1_i1.p1  ORF type:complete len:418 (-),score=87.25 TRINITY_DN472_c0_g1_i1:98-1351(-)
MALTLEGIGILVPTDRIGRVIGRGGMGLRRMREEAGVKVVVDSSEDPYSASSRRVNLTGSVAAISGAFAILSEAAFKNNGDNLDVGSPSEGDSSSPVVIVPASSIGRVIGKGGDNLKRIREQTGVHISPEREDATRPGGKVPERLITLTGPVERLPAALQCVLTAAAETAKREQGAAFEAAGGAGVAALSGAGMPGQAGMMHMGYSGGKGMGMPGGMAGMMGVGMGMGMGMLGQGPAGAPFGTGLRLQSVAPGEIQLHVHVPDKLVGALVGKAGVRVKQTSADAGCKISMTSREACPDRRAVVIGTLAQATKAQELLHAQLVEAAEAQNVPMDELSVTFFVPKEDASAVIGKQASTLKAIREQTSVKVQFIRDEFCGHRPCTVTGALANVLQAEQLIHEKLSGQAANSDNMPVPPGF